MSAALDLGVLLLFAQPLCCALLMGTLALSEKAAIGFGFVLVS
jgi:hypothetical protein